jgi:hypothetical protein
MTRTHGKHRAVAAAVLVGAVVALAVPGSVAVAVLSSPELWHVAIGPTATLQARGAAVSVPVTVTCPAGSFAALDLSLTQRAGNQVVTGSRSTSPQCTGAEQALVINVTAQTGSRAFKRGEAFVEATLFGCTYACGTFATDSRTVTVRR